MVSATEAMSTLSTSAIDFAEIGSSATKIKASTAPRSSVALSSRSPSISEGSSTSTAITSAASISVSFARLASPMIFLTYCAGDDFSKRHALSQGYFAQAHQFQNRKKGHYQLAPRLRLFEEVKQINFAGRTHHISQALDHFGHRYFLARNLHLQF